MIKPYVFFIHKEPNDIIFALDRSYSVIEGKYDTKIDVSDIVQVEVFKGYPYLSHPGLNKQELEEYEWLALWTNYYE